MEELTARQFTAGRKPHLDLSRIEEVWERTHDVAQTAIELGCSKAHTRTHLMRRGLIEPLRRIARPDATPKKTVPRSPLFRCHCCSQVRTTPTCPVTGEVIASAYL